MSNALKKKKKRNDYPLCLYKVFKDYIYIKCLFKVNTVIFKGFLLTDERLSN